MNITLPEFCLVALIGVTGSGKSTFARTHFKPTEILSSDTSRGWVSDDENDQSVSEDAFDVLHYVGAKRLKNMKMAVIDATNVQDFARKKLVALAKEYHALPIAIVLDLPERVCRERNSQRPDRQFGPHVIKRQRGDLKRSLDKLQGEGFRRIFVLKSEDEIAAARIVREPLWVNKRAEHGPFDIIGDIHGCYDELVLLLGDLGYTVDKAAATATPPDGRKAFFLGDLCDRGPNTPQVYRLVMNMVEAGTALCVPGNHDAKLLKALRGRNVNRTHGLDMSLEQLEAETPEFRAKVAEFIDSLVSHYVLDAGKLVAAHAGMKAEMQGRTSGAVREFALYGETTGETDEFGLPVRINWAADYRGRAMVVYGHTPVPQPEWLNNTINIDTGCVFGGALTALRYPERELVSVDALQTYAESKRPFKREIGGLTAQHANDDVLDIADVSGRRIIDTSLLGSITVREENAAAALEAMSRFAVNPRWLVYLPPTMSPCDTARDENEEGAAHEHRDLLEHPSEAFAYYEAVGVQKVICEEKHMGSRAIVIVCRDEDTAQERFGVVGEGIGTVYTRTGRRFFTDDVQETAFLARLRDAVTRAGWWEGFQTNWVALDCELMPWSAKAQQLIRDQYAAVGSAAKASLTEAVAVLRETVAKNSQNTDLGALLARYETRASQIDQYVNAYRRYCWPVESLDDLKLAPFHLLATEGKLHTDRDHLWHMQTLAKLADDPLIMATECRVVDLTDAQSVEQATAWWETLTARGGEGMVVKPLDYIVKSRRGLVQPAIKVRGREYLRIIYGPEYDTPENLTQLRRRALRHKRSLALREFALGVEGLQRFVNKEPLRRVHECVFAVLALESEPVDPRL